MYMYTYMTLFPVSALPTACQNQLRATILNNMRKASHGTQAVAHDPNELAQPINIGSCKGPQSSFDNRLNAKITCATCSLRTAVQKKSNIFMFWPLPAPYPGSQVFQRGVGGRGVSL